jgi:hypothetical protein
MDYNIALIIFLTICVILTLYFFKSSIKKTLHKHIKNDETPKIKKLNPKQELADYFAYNWDDLKVHFFSKDCNNIKIPIKLEEDFYNRFGQYFAFKNNDPVIEAFAFRNYQMTFKMEFREICQTLTTLKKYLLNNQDINLNSLGKYLELLHNEHFPQAVFIAVILDEMVRTCQKYPELTLHQIGQTNSLLTMKVIDSI